MNSRTFINITMSLDGYIAGEDVTPVQPMGRDGELLHEWFFAKKVKEDEALQKQLVERTGAVIIGNGVYKNAIDQAWRGKTPFHASAFVHCSNPPDKSVTGFIYTQQSIRETLGAAINTAEGKDVWIMGGANIIKQYLNAGLVEEMTVHVAPVLLGHGTRLFDGIQAGRVRLQIVETAGSMNVSHLNYRVISHLHGNATYL